LARAHETYRHCYDIFRQIPFDESDVVRLSQSEYNSSFFNNVLFGSRVDKVFEKFGAEFRNLGIRDWPDKIKELTTSASIKDAKSVKEYLQLLQSSYGKLPEGQRESILMKD